MSKSSVSNAFLSKKMEKGKVTRFFFAKFLSLHIDNAIFFFWLLDVFTGGTKIMSMHLGDDQTLEIKKPLLELHPQELKFTCM